MKHGKTLSIILMLLVCMCVSVFAESQMAAALDFSGGFDMAEVQKAKATGFTYGVSLRYGYDFSSHFNIFSEVGCTGFSPKMQKNNFQNAYGNFNGFVGIGTAFSFGRGFSIALSGGGFVGKLFSSVEMAETGLYVTLSPKYLLFSPMIDTDCLNYSVSLPISALFSGYGYHIKAGVAIGIDISTFGKRTSSISNK